MNNLTTLAAVKTYLGIPSTVQDQFISSLIPRASDQVQRYCGQEFPSKSYVGYRLSGTGSDRIMLPGPPRAQHLYRADRLGGRHGIPRRHDAAGLHVPG